MSGLAVSPLDAGIVIGYFAFTVALGLWFGRRRIKTADSLFLADREATWPVIGASMFSANISSQQFVGQAGLAYSIGLVAGAFQLVGALCFMLLAVFFVDVYLTLRLRTAPEFFERRYNSGARLFVSGINIAMILSASIATALYAGATVLLDLLGDSVRVDFNVAVAVIALAAGTYTVLGGLRSVLWTDLLQATLLLVGGAVTLVLSVQAAGGWAAVVDGDGGSRWSVVQPWDHVFGWFPLLTGAMILGVHGHCTDHDYVQRALAARSVFHSKMGALLAAFLKILALFIIAAPGVLAARLLPGLAHPDQAYAKLVTGVVPPGLAGLVLAGLLAAILGTVAAGLSAAASLVTYDFGGRLLPRLGEAARVRVGRLVMVALLVLCSALAPKIRSFPGVFAYLVQVWSLLAPPVFVCVVFGVFTRSASARGANATLVAGTALGAIAFWGIRDPTVSTALPAYFLNPLNCGFVITIACALVMLGFSRGASARPSPKDASAHPPIARPHAGAMSRTERRIYLASLTALLVLWLAVILIFSPWGPATTKT